MKIGEMTVREVTEPASGSYRVRLFGGFSDASTDLVLVTRQKLTVGQVLTLEDGASEPDLAFAIPSPVSGFQKSADATPKTVKTETAPAKAESSPVTTENKSTAVN